MFCGGVSANFFILLTLFIIGGVVHLIYNGGRLYQRKKKVFLSMLPDFLFWVVCLFILVTLIADSPVAYQRTLEQLETAHGICYNPNESRGTTIFNLQEGSVSPSSKFYFDLCDIPQQIIDVYNGKRIEVWHKDGLVYQMSYDGEIQYSIDHCNSQIMYYNLRVHFYLYLFAIIFVGMGYISICEGREQNDEGYGRKTV